MTLFKGVSAWFKYGSQQFLHDLQVIAYWLFCPLLSQMNADGENHRDDPLHGSIGGFSNP